jgi:3-dehydroquinate dehydratase
MSSEDFLLIRSILKRYKVHLVDLEKDFKIDVKRTPYNAKWHDNQKKKQNEHHTLLAQIDDLIKKIDNGKSDTL